MITREDLFSSASGRVDDGPGRVASVEDAGSVPIADNVVRSVFFCIRYFQAPLHRLACMTLTALTLCASTAAGLSLLYALKALELAP